MIEIRTSDVRYQCVFTGTELEREKKNNDQCNWIRDEADLSGNGASK